MVTRAAGTDEGAVSLFAAGLALTYAHELNAGTGEDYYTFSDGDPSRAQVFLIHQPELVLYQVDAGNGPADLNRDELDAFSREAIDAYKEQSEHAVSETATYNTILDIAPDGAIDRVEWRVDAATGASTVAARNPARRARRIRPALLSSSDPRGTADLAKDGGAGAGECRLCKNASGYDIPANSVVEVSGWDVAEGVISVVRPVSTDREAIYLVPHEIKVGRIGKCYETGTRVVLFDATNPSDPPSDPVAIGNRLGSQADAFSAQKSPAGNLLVHSVIRAATVADPTGLALVLLGNAPEMAIVIVVDATGAAAGNYKVKRWGTGASIAGTGAAFDAIGDGNQYINNDISIAVRDADGVWVLLMSPYTKWY